MAIEVTMKPAREPVQALKAQGMQPYYIHSFGSRASDIIRKELQPGRLVLVVRAWNGPEVLLIDAEAEATKAWTVRAGDDVLLWPCFDVREMKLCIDHAPNPFKEGQLENIGR